MVKESTSDETNPNSVNGQVETQNLLNEIARVTVDGLNTHLGGLKTAPAPGQGSLDEVLGMLEHDPVINGKKGFCSSCQGQPKAKKNDHQTS